MTYLCSLYFLAQQLFLQSVIVSKNKNVKKNEVNLCFTSAISVNSILLQKTQTNDTSNNPGDDIHTSSKGKEVKVCVNITPIKFIV